MKQLAEYVAGKRQNFNLPLEQQGTDFQRKVWKQARAIPAGKTMSYGQLAKKIGHANASRAVGTALGKNPIPIIVPCHRIIPASGGVGQFAWGSDKKEWLLQLEKGK